MCSAIFLEEKNAFQRLMAKFNCMKHFLQGTQKNFNLTQKIDITNLSKVSFGCTLHIITLFKFPLLSHFYIYFGAQQHFIVRITMNEVY